MMNERINELVVESGNGQMRNGKLYPHIGSRTEEDWKKFAELIVQECIGCCEQVISDPVPESVDTWLNGGSQCIDEIKKHFGVEE